MAPTKLNNLGNWEQREGAVSFVDTEGLPQSSHANRGGDSTAQRGFPHAPASRFYDMVIDPVSEFWQLSGVVTFFRKVND